MHVLKGIMAYDKLILTDFETTGLDPKRHEIIEIGAILCDTKTLEIHWEYEQKLKPVCLHTAQPEALAVNGYTPELWKDAKAFVPGFLEFLAKLDHTMIFTGQNVWFDVGFYQQALETIRNIRFGDITVDPLDPTPYGYSYHRLDIASMAWPFQTDPVYRMRQLSELFGVPGEAKPHRAINGVRNEYRLLKQIRERGLHVSLPDLTCDTCRPTIKGHAYDCPNAQV